ncbi:MAG: hypothetical protein JSU68_06115 [Phycisphaerales bacterium]|nr:MAG: hypothetical protein JSU68_06115 [Phycisphaerales bacterium]
MKRTCCLLLALSFWPLIALADDKKSDEMTDPLEILKKVDAAAKAVNAVKYEAVLEPTEGAAAQGGNLKATVIATGYAHGEPEKYYVDVTYQMPSEEQTRHITGGTDGEDYYVIDHQAKKAHVDIDPAVMGPHRIAITRGWMIEFLHDTPFSDEINGRSRELLPSEMIAGEDCYTVRVVYQAEGASVTTWCFSKKDFLPRRRVDVWTRQDGSRIGQCKTITKLEVDPKIDENTFKLKVPEGYEKTDEFAT